MIIKFIIESLCKSMQKRLYHISTSSNNKCISCKRFTLYTILILGWKNKYVRFCFVYVAVCNIIRVFVPNCIKQSLWGSYCPSMTNYFPKLTKVQESGRKLGQNYGNSVSLKENVCKKDILCTIFF